MDLGATICRPRSAALRRVPAARGVRGASRAAIAETLPERTARAARPHRYGVAYWIERGGQVWLVRRPAKGLLGGMAALPGERIGRELRAERPERSAPSATSSRISRSTSTSCRAPSRTARAGGIRSTALGEAGLPTLYRRAAELARMASARARGLKKAQVALKRRANPFLSPPGKQGNSMDDRFNTIAGWVLFAGIVALGSSIVAGEMFH